MDLSHNFAAYDAAVAPSARRGLPVLRVVDICVAFAGLVVFAPVLVLIALAIRIESHGAAIFTQERLGRGRVPFTLYKFRSMVNDAERDTGQVWATRNDARITRVGMILRRTRLDELPQLFNVLRGDMSMVGPRPIREHFANQLAALEPIYDRRFLVRPGLTGYAQLYAPYGSNVQEQLAKVPFDQRYANEGLTLRAYVALILRTAVTCIATPFGR